jgi:hypothetical protein
LHLGKKACRIRGPISHGRWFVDPCLPEMKPSIARVSIFVAFCLAGLLQADTKLGVEPTLGVVVRGDQKVWFDGDSIRTESYQDGKLAEFHVTGGRGSWLAYPEIGRVLTTTVDRQHWRSYQEQARQFFSRTTNHFRLGEEEFLGLPCWRYEWQTRSSSKWGWSTLMTTSFSCDGEVITATRTDVHRDQNGERITGPTETVRPFDEAVMQFNHPMRVPKGRGVYKTGTDEVIGFKADVLEVHYIDQRYWVIDHPQFGAFSARLVIGGDTPETNEVVRIWVGD